MTLLKRHSLPALIALAAAAAAIIAAVPCPIRSLTGLSCPGCGTTRALGDLLGGHALEALSHNYFLVVSAPYIALLAYSAIADRGPAKSIYRLLTAPAAIGAMLSLSVAWWIARNIINL